MCLERYVAICMPLRHADIFSSRTRLDSHEGGPHRQGSGDLHLSVTKGNPKIKARDDA
ncbi:hypothetical protein Z043_124614, partial [Scleropages formosus]